MFWAWWGIVSRDVKLSLWRSESLALSLTFGVLVVLTFAIATNPQELKVETISGVLWCGFAFSGIVNLTGSLRREKESGGLELMKLAGLPSEIIYLGKIFSSFVAIAVSSLVIGMAGGVMFNLTLNLVGVLQLCAIASLGTLGICAAGTLIAAISSELKGGESLLVALLMPLLFPVVISSTISFSSVLLGEGMKGKWLGFSAVYTGVFLLVSILLFEEVIE